jgi:hypothetical protein
VQLCARDHSDRFKNGAHHAGLQENERREVRLNGMRNPRQFQLPPRAESGAIRYNHPAHVAHPTLR